MHSRQMQQRGVGHLSVADDFRNQFVKWGRCQRWCALCILMMGMGNKTLE